MNINEVRGSPAKVEVGVCRYGGSDKRTNTEPEFLPCTGAYPCTGSFFESAGTAAASALARTCRARS